MARLDVAMFNAILRESADEIPTDPVSDPISDSKVLPIPAGKSSFGAGAQLKNAVSYATSIFSSQVKFQDLAGIQHDRLKFCMSSINYVFHTLTCHFCIKFTSAKFVV